MVIVVMSVILSWLETNLKGITNHNEEFIRVRGDRDPQPIVGGNLKAIHVVGSHDGQDLRVRMLSKANVVIVVTVIINIIILVLELMWLKFGRVPVLVAL